MLVVQSSIPSMNPESIEQAHAMETAVLELPQINITTWHTLHAGVYSRTIFMPKDSVVVGAVIKRSVNLVVSGHVIVSIGEDKAIEYIGYFNLTAQANRKQVFIAKEDTYLTMYFATESKTIEDAENEFTDDVDKLISRHIDAINHVVITGV